MSVSPYVAITISRQLGSGGTYLGQQLARRLEYRYLDRDILQRAAETLESDATTPRKGWERRSWEAMMLAIRTWRPETPYLPPSWQSPAKREHLDAEADILRHLAAEQNIVVLGHGGFYHLRSHPRLISLFCCAPVPFRLQRLIEIYQVGETDARAMIEAADVDRERYVRVLCGRHWTDARNYHLCIDTSLLEMEDILDKVGSYIDSRLRTDVQG